MLTTFIMTMRGTPYYYNGDELGMINIKFNNIADYRDVQTINGYKSLQLNGGDTAQYLELQKFASRDNGRTPFQWDASANAGFTRGTPWIKVNPDYTNVNEAVQNKNPASVLNYFRKVVRLRKDNPVLVYGKYHLLDENNPDVFAYTREGAGKKILVMLNFTAAPATAVTGIDIRSAKLLLNNYTTAPKIGTLRPYEAVVYRLAP
jgi:oligo-1,6-glucosidase